MATDRAMLKLKILSVFLPLICGYYFVGYLSDPIELLRGSGSNRAEAIFRLVFVLATLCAILAAPGLYMLRTWGAQLAIAGGALLSLHLAFVLAESFSISAISELPFSFFSLIFWLMLYGADLLGPVLIALLTRPSVRALLH
jgi:hypothetical protein